MKIKFFLILFLVSIFISCKTIEKKAESNNKIKIEWIENLEGDFSFKEKWSYPEGVYKNRHGQLSCDGICPIEIDRMKDGSGKIYKDSLEVFYKIIDTTHIFHSLKSENRMYEYSGTDLIEFKKLKNGIVKGKSINNVSTHSSLNIELQNDSCNVFVKFNSIRDLGINYFPLKNGIIKIDRALFENGIIKAVFDFKFVNTLESDKELFWKGKIYNKVITK
nr:hypothetical protein [uncultured Psychroserpens sp.]